MTLPEAAERFCIDRSKLEFYEQNGLFDNHRLDDGSVDYQEETLEYISLIEILLSAGLDMCTLKKYIESLNNSNLCSEMQIKILMKQRYELLDDIHEKQKILDKLDYIIREEKSRHAL